MWISVDRYLAVRKPLRYETVQTKTRCQCWMCFTWISAAMLCCPPIFGKNEVHELVITIITSKTNYFFCCCSQYLMNMHIFVCWIGRTWQHIVLH